MPSRPNSGRKSGTVYKDLTGQVFERLTVVEYLGNDAGGNAIWKCLCSCGNYHTALGARLRYGDTRSCGCLQKERAGISNRKSYGEAAFTNLYGGYKSAAKKRGYTFELTRDEFRALVVSDCFYCGRKPSNVHKIKTAYGEFIYTGIDRYNNVIGYELNNCVPCCKDCNYAKKEMNGPEYLDLCRRVAGNWSNRDMEQERIAA